MLEEDEVDTTVDSEVESEVEEQEVPKKTTKVTTRRESSREEKRQPTLEELLEVKSEAIERRKENKALKGTVSGLEKQIAELKQLMDSQAADFEATKRGQQDRIVRTTLLSALNKEGCIKPDMVLDLIAKDAKFDKHGDVTNHAEIINAFKEQNAFFFTGPATTQTNYQTPKPIGPAKNAVEGMTNDQIKEALRTKFNVPIR